MAAGFEWKTTQYKLRDLKPWQDNPKYSTKSQAARLLKSWEKFGQVQTIAVGPNAEVYDGHQRLSALLTMFGPDHTIDVRQSNAPLTEDQRKELVITIHAAAVGSWNWDALAGWDASEMVKWGFNTDVLGEWKANVGALNSLIMSEQESIIDLGIDSDVDGFAGDPETFDGSFYFCVRLPSMGGAEVKQALTIFCTEHHTEHIIKKIK